VRQYTPEGSFNSFAVHLPRLKDMGVETLWFIPVTPISKIKRLGSLGSYYACSSYTKINPEFGTMDDFKNLVQQAHTLGMKVIIDWVANHTGCDHERMKKFPEYYLKNNAGNYTELNGWTDVYDLDYENASLRKAMIEAMQFWIRECDIDGFRCDMAHLVPLDFWEEAKLACEKIKNLFWLAECEAPAYYNVFHAMYSWEWMHTSEGLMKGTASLQQMKNVLLNYKKNDAGKKLFFTSNHDENSWNGTEYEKYGDAAKAFAVLTVTWPGMPLIYSGQELPNYKRLKFFDKDQIEWSSNIALHSFYKALLQLKKNNDALKDEAACTILTTPFDDKIFAYLLSNKESKVVVLLNLSSSDRLRFSINQNIEGNFINIFSGFTHHFTNSQNFELQRYEYLVYASN
jgi:glycosidase